MGGGEDKNQEGGITVTVVTIWAICESCGRQFDANSPDAKTLTVYRNPFSEDHEDYFFCDEECLNVYERRYRDEMYTYCPNCDKMITTNDNYGASYFRCLYDGNDERVDDIVCEKCYEEKIIAQGQSAVDFANSWLMGGLWMDRISEEGRKALSEQYVTISDYRLDREMTPARCNFQARKMREKGHKVLMVYVGNSRHAEVKIVSAMIKKEEAYERKLD